VKMLHTVMTYIYFRLTQPSQATTLHHFLGKFYAGMIPHYWSTYHRTWGTDSSKTSNCFTVSSNL